MARVTAPIRGLLYYFSIVIVLLTPRYLSAHTPLINEPLKTHAEKQSFIHGNLEADFHWRDGNDEMWESSLILRLRQAQRFAESSDANPMAFRQPKELRFLLLESRQGERRDEFFMDNALVHARYIWMHSKKFGYEGFAQFSRNEFLNLKHRTLASAAVRYRLLETSKFVTFASAGYTQEWQHIDRQHFAGDNPNKNSRGYLSLSLYAGDYEDSIWFVSTVSYLPVIGSSDDYRMRVESDIEFRIKRDLSFIFYVDWTYDSHPIFKSIPADTYIHPAVRWYF